MKKKLGLLLRGLVVVSRDMLTGFFMGICSAVVLVKINPGLSKAVALLVPAGIFAGISKGLVKFIFLNISGSLPSKGYRMNYPKYKILIFWLIIFFGSFLFAFGFKPDVWFKEPLRLMKTNYLLGNVDTDFWSILFVFIVIIGLFSYIYEPPVNQEEVLPE